MGAEMTAWFVSTTRPLPKSEGDVEWLLMPFATEEEAKEHASKALVRGMRIEAGTIPGSNPGSGSGGPRRITGRSRRMRGRSWAFWEG